MILLTLVLLTWRIWWAPSNARKWQMGFDSVFEELKCRKLLAQWHGATSHKIGLLALLYTQQTKFYVFYDLFSVHSCIIFFKWSQLGAHYFLVYLFQLLYMFRATMCPSLAGLLQQTSHPPTQSAKYHCHADTISSPNDGHIVARNM